jgi:hypothetical protein
VRLLVRHADYLSKFRVCVHSLSLAKRWAAGEGRSRPAATKPPPPAMPEDQECEAEGTRKGRACSDKIRKGVTDASGKWIRKSIRPVTRREVPGIDGARWLCKACWRATQRLDGPALQAMFGAAVRFCPLAVALHHHRSSDPLQRARRARKMGPVMRSVRAPGLAHRRRGAPRTAPAAVGKAATAATEAEITRAPAPACTTRAAASAVALQAAAESAAEAAALECEGHASPRARSSAMKSTAASRPPTPVTHASSGLRSLSRHPGALPFLPSFLPR